MKFARLCAALCCVFLASLTQAAPLSSASITGSYSAGEFMLLDGNFGNTAPGVDAVFAEFITVDADFNTWFQIDFTEDGLVTFFSNQADAWTSPASQLFTFSFAGQSAALSGVSIIDTGSVSGQSASTVSLIDGNSFAVDLSNLQWDSAFASFSAQLQFGSNDVPLPGTLALLLAGLGLGLLRRQR